MSTQAVAEAGPIVRIEGNHLHIGELKLPKGSVRSIWRADLSQNIEFNCVLKSKPILVKAVFPTLEKAKSVFVMLKNDSHIPIFPNQNMIVTFEKKTRNFVIGERAEISEAIWDADIRNLESLTQEAREFLDLELPA